MKEGRNPEKSYISCASKNPEVKVQWLDENTEETSYSWVRKLDILQMPKKGEKVRVGSDYYLNKTKEY